MFKLENTIKSNLEDFNSDLEFWPSQAEKFLDQKEFAKVIELCEQNLVNTSDVLSAKLIYSRALIKIIRYDEAIEQLYRVLAIDPDHVVALKLLGDIRFAQEDVASAMASYCRVLEIDPDCRGIKSEWSVKEPEQKPAIKLTLQRAPENTVTVAAAFVERPFRTETVGDLYLAQGQPRLALEIYRELSNLHQNSRISEKLTNAEKMVAMKERRDV